MDFRTKIDNQVFGVRGTALIIREGQIYLCKSGDGFYYTVGGAVEVGEGTESAVYREALEEVGCEVTVDQLAFVVENTFCQDGVNFHNIEFHYQVTPLTEPHPNMVTDDEILSCEWIDFDKLDTINLNPPFLKTALKDWDGQVKHIVNMEEKTGGS